MSGLIIASAIGWAGWHVAAQIRSASGGSATRDRLATLLTLFAPAVAATQQDPRAFLVWQPMAKAARELFPEEFVALDRATGGRFPFPVARIEAAHAQWTAEWLAWELAHATEYKLKAVAAQQDLADQGSSGTARAKVDAIEREKLELYQRRYAEYIQTAKALQALLQT